MVEVDITETRQQLERASNLSVQNTLTLLFHHFLKHGPQTEQELQFFIKEYLHLTIPDQPICANHVTPLKMISDLYFEKVQSVFGFANRSGGKTQNVATLNFLDSIFKQVKITSAGATLDQSGLAYEYYLNFWNEPLINANVLIERSVQSETILQGGGRVNIVSGTRAGLNGQHPPLVGETPIETPCNRSKYPNGIPIGLLAKRNKKFYVWSYDERQKQIVLSLAKAFQTGTAVPVFTVRYKWSSRKKGRSCYYDEITATADHTLLMKDGSYKAVEHLQIGDRLEPYYRYVEKGWKTDDFYVKFRTPRSTQDLYEHRAYFERRKNGSLTPSQIVHHLNENPLDNRWNNLQVLSRAEHNTLHMTGVPKDFKKIFGVDHNEQRKKLGRKETGVEPVWQSKDFLLEEYVNKKRTCSAIARECGTSVQTILKWVTRFALPKPSHAELTKRGEAEPNRTRKYKDRKKKSYTDNEYSANHEVVSVIPAGRADVFCLEVEDTHNYAAKGLFHHNCKARIDEIELIDWCLPADTKIEVLRNREKYPEGIPIQSLVGKSHLYVYCYSTEDKQFHIRKILKVSPVAVRPLMKISYEWWSGGNGTPKVLKTDSITITPEHQFLLLNHSYVQAQDLQVGDRLRAFAQMTQQPGKHIRINVSSQRTNILEHRFFYEEVHGKVGRKTVIHHKNHHPQDNRLSNLAPMSFGEHLREHHLGVTRSKETCQKIALAAQKRGEPWKQLIRDARHREFEAVKHLRPWTDKEKFLSLQRQEKTSGCMAKVWQCSPETVRVWASMHHCVLETHHKSDAANQAVRDARQREFEAVKHLRPWTDKEKLKQAIDRYHSSRGVAKHLGCNSETVRVWAKTHQLSFSAVPQEEQSPTKPYQHKVWLETQYLRRRYTIRQIADHCSVHWNTIQHWLEVHDISRRTHKHAGTQFWEDKALPNHRVTKIEEVPAEMTYTMAVEGIHNYVANGVVVKNSILQEGLSMSVTVENDKGKFLGQDCMTSTRKKETGSVQRILNEADKRHIEVYSWCVHGETLIYSPDGAFSIQDAVGERKRVYARKEDGSLCVQLSHPIVQTGMKSLYAVTYKWGGRHPKIETLHCTGEHEVMLEDGRFLRADQVTVGRVLMPFPPYEMQRAFEEADRQRVVSVEKVEGIYPVYDLHVPVYHNFAANSIFIHNCVLESMEKCEHDCHDFKKTHKNDPTFQNTKQCPIYEMVDVDGTTSPFCNGIAHQANGFIHVEEVIRKTRILDKGTLDLQWLCKKGRSDAAVYRNHYSENVHEVTHEQFKQMMEKMHGSKYDEYIQTKLQRIGGIDFGGNHATLIALKDANTSPNPTYYFIDEHYRLPEQDVLNAQHVKDIKKLDYYKKGLLFWGDTAQRQDILEFQSLGLNVKPANKSVFAGIDYLKTLMKRHPPHLRPCFYVIKDRCPKLAAQLQLYAHPKRADGTIDVDKIITQQDDHAPDAARYLCYSDKTIPTRVRTYRANI